jgi:gas vesicle protein
MNHRDEEHYLTASLVSFLAGSIVGAGIALLLAPQSGEYTRREMREKAERAIIRLHRMEDEIKDAMNDVIHSIRLKASQLVDVGKGMAEAKKSGRVDVIAAGKSVLEQKQSRLDNAKQNA